MVIGSGVLLLGVAENPTFPILSALAYATGLGYRPTCDKDTMTTQGKLIYDIIYKNCYHFILRYISRRSKTAKIIL